jgi:hypothetical protein
MYQHARAGTRLSTLLLTLHGPPTVPKRCNASLTPANAGDEGIYLARAGARPVAELRTDQSIHDFATAQDQDVVEISTRWLGTRCTPFPKVPLFCSGDR